MDANVGKMEGFKETVAKRESSDRKYEGKSGVGGGRTIGIKRREAWVRERPGSRR